MPAIGSTPEEKRKKVAEALFSREFPGLSKAYDADPRTQLALTALGQGASTTPVASPLAGVARALQGTLGGYMAKKQLGRYAAEEAATAADINKARLPVAADAAGAAAAQGVVPAPTAGVDEKGVAGEDKTGIAAKVAGALAGANQPAPAQAPPPVIPPPVAQPQAVPGPGMVAPNAAPPMAAPSAPQGAPPAGPPGAPMPGSPMPRRTAVPNPTEAPTVPVAVGGVNSDMSRAFYKQGILPIEGGSDPHTGKFRTSPAGAIGPAQLMPGTAPEAMRLAGLDPNDQRWRTDYDVNVQAGQAYYDEMLRQFKDPAMAAAAYNTGPGNMRRTLRRWDAAGRKGDWANYLPYRETKRYVANFRNRSDNIDFAAEGTTGPSEADTGAPPQFAVDELPPEAKEVQRPSLGERVRSARMQVAYNLLSDPEAQANPTRLYRASDPEWEAGTKEEQELKKQRDENEAQLTNTAYSYDLSQRNQLNENRQRAMIDERQAQIAANMGMTQEEWKMRRQAEIDAEKERTQHGYRMEELGLKGGHEDFAGQYGIDRTDGLYGVLSMGGSGKRPMDATTSKTLSGLVSQQEAMDNLRTGFKDEYFGYGSKYIGNTNLWLEEHSPFGNEDRVDFWKRYNTMDQVVRHELYGSALTDSERKLWDASVIDPGTRASVARKNFDTRMQIINAALERKARASATVYNPAQVWETVGGESAAKRISDYQPLYKAKVADGTRKGRPAGTPRTPQRVGQYVYKNGVWYEETQ